MKNDVKKSKRTSIFFILKHIAFLFCFLMVFFIFIESHADAQGPKVSYSYNLSSFNGPLLNHWANITVDKERQDVFVYDRRERNVRIYDENGMEVYIFGDDGIFGTINDLTVDGNGNIMIISRTTGTPVITVCNYRGEPISQIELKNFPREFSRFRPDYIIYRDEKLYLADKSGLRIAVTDKNGNFQTGYDIAHMLNIDENKRGDNEMTGFDLDGEGNMLYTISVLFQAYRLSPDGEQEVFGKSGGGPGTFGVIAGIAAEEKGYIYVADKLRCVVLVFDNNLEFLTEFGYRGPRPGNLIVPNDIEVGSDGKIYVAQAGGRGVSVFSISHN